MSPRAAVLVCAVAVVFPVTLSLGACTSDAPSADAGPPSEASAPVDGGAEATTTCPNDLPKACPSPPPSYAGAIAPLVELRCAPCHSGASPIGTYDFTTYDGLASRRSLVLNQVYGCRMPPADAAAPTADERAALLAWLVCRAPNN